MRPAELVRPLEAVCLVDRLLAECRPTDRGPVESVERGAAVATSLSEEESLDSVGSADFGEVDADSEDVAAEGDSVTAGGSSRFRVCAVGDER